MARAGVFFFTLPALAEQTWPSDEVLLDVSQTSVLQSSMGIGDHRSFGSNMTASVAQLQAIAHDLAEARQNLARGYSVVMITGR